MITEKQKKLKREYDERMAKLRLQRSVQRALHNLYGHKSTRI